MPKSRALTIVLVTLLALSAFGGVANACPMCKAALASHDKAQGDIVQGFFWSILFLLSMPFLLLGAFTTYMWLLVRRSKRLPPGLFAGASPPPDAADVRLRSASLVSIAPETFEAAPAELLEV